jgi:hypothetical protein
VNHCRVAQNRKVEPRAIERHQLRTEFRDAVDEPGNEFFRRDLIALLGGTGAVWPLGASVVAADARRLQPGQFART